VEYCKKVLLKLVVIKIELETDKHGFIQGGFNFIEQILRGDYLHQNKDDYYFTQDRNPLRRA